MILTRVKALVAEANLDNPKGSLKKIEKYAREHPVIDYLLKGTQTLEWIKKREEQAAENSWGYSLKKGLEELRVNYSITNLENIPNEGGTIYVANHPYGIIDAMLMLGGLGEAVKKQGKDFKVVGGGFFKMIQGLEKELFLVHNSDSKYTNPFSGLKEIFHYLQQGGNLGIFPSGKTSGPKLKECKWNSGLARLAQYSNYVVPMWFSGPDHGTTYNFLSRFFPSLKIALAFTEAWDKKGKHIELNIGKPISREEIRGWGLENTKLTQEIRKRAELLKR